MKINLYWQSGKKLVVEIDPLAQTKDVVDIAYHGINFLCYPFLIHNGSLLDLSMTLKTQGIKENDIMIVYEHSETFGNQEEQVLTKLLSLGVTPKPKYSFSDDVCSLANEVLRINDSRYTMIEQILESDRSFLQKLKSKETHDKNMSIPTIIPEKSQYPSMGPLVFTPQEPKQYSNEEGKINISMFRNIEDAARFFEKNTINEWKW